MREARTSFILKGPRADQTGRIHISDFRNPRTITTANAAGPYMWVTGVGLAPLSLRSAALRRRSYTVVH